MATRKKAAKKKNKKALKKKTLKKKTFKKKTAKRKAVKKKAARKKPAAKKAAKKKTPKKKPARKKPSPRAKPRTTGREIEVRPGPPSMSVPPVEEPQVSADEAIGVVTHYYSHLSVAVIQMNKGVLRTGDTIHIKGHTTDFTQIVESMEYEHQHIDEASAGQSFGIKVKDHAREHDIVYLVK